MAKRILNWSKGGKIFAKILLMLIFCAVLSFVPFLVEDAVDREFVFPAGIDDGGVFSNIFFHTMLFWFAGFLVLMLLINLVFFIIDEYRNDLVKWRRRFQVVLNICVILGGLITGYMLLSFFTNQTWWVENLSDNTFLKKLTEKWAYLAFGLCSAFQFFWDVWLFGPENRSPMIAKWLHRSALKQELKKGNRT